MLLTARTLRVSVATAAAALAVTVGLTACGSDDESDTATATSTSATASSMAEPSDTTDAASPLAEELQATLALLADPAASIDEKTAVLANGEARVSNIETLNATLAGYGTLKFALSDVQEEGETATAQVVIKSPNGAGPAMPMTWEKIDGTWKLSDASTCSILAFAAPCAP